MNLSSPVETTPPKLSGKRNLADLLSIELCLEIIYENKNAVKRATVASYKEEMFAALSSFFTLPFLSFSQLASPGKRTWRKSSCCC